MSLGVNLYAGSKSPGVSDRMPYGIYGQKSLILTWFTNAQFSRIYNIYVIHL